ncbi:MAG: GvpL/GvpF family gas vesicle protein [Candidatus Limnocylindria bacterium]
MTAHAGTATLVYMYAVATAEAADRWTSGGAPKGLEGGSLRTIEESGLAAIVSDVPGDLYDQEALDESVRDAGWLTPRATAHQTVNAAAHAALDAVLPVPFATIFTTEDRVREMLRVRAEELRAKLAGVRGQAEWVVGLYRDVTQAAEHLSQVSDAVAHREHDTGPGRRYLEERKAEGARRAELGGLDGAAADSAHEMLARASRHSFDEPVVREAGDLVARTTYLVRREDEHRLEDTIRRFNSDWQDRGYELRATGPWPPYRTSGAAE